VTQHLGGLNNKQREAALHMKGPLLIVAGAGAGKTKTITHRIVNLIKEGVAPEKILAVTFTNKAAKEMRERISAAIENSFAGNPFSEVLGKNPQTVRKSIPSSAPFVSTFHSLGVYIIKENARLLGLTKHFTILDEGDSVSLIKDAMKEVGIDPKQYEPRKIKGIISKEKGKFTKMDEFIEKSTGSMDKIVSQIWRLYENKKAKENSLDFDDLLLKSTKLLKENEEIRKLYQEKWEYIHIDEYQDTNEVQYLMSKLLSAKHKNICVVGDADQNIYSWRGANLKNILSFEKDYPDAKIVLLEENYRSTQNILEAANEIIKKNKFRPDKNLFTKNKTGDKIGLYEAMNEADEADFVATKILEIQDGTGSVGDTFSQVLGKNPQTIRKSTSDFALDNEVGVPMRSVSQADGPRGSAGSVEPDSDPAEAARTKLSEVAVLYRANFQSRVLEEAMIKYNIPYQVLGIKFFERKEIKDTLAYLRAALNPQSLSDVKRIINFPTRGIGKVTLAKIFSGEKDSLPIKVKIKVDNFYKILEEIKEKIESSKASETIKFTVKKSGIEDELAQGNDEEIEKLENIKELATLALKYDNLSNGAGIERLLEDASLASDQDSIMLNEEKKKKIDAVKLMTVHAAKGLEFKYVFITGLEDGLFPHEKRNERKSGEDSEEERRLFYVALTRAKEKLFLSFANFRTIFGSTQINTPSEFIADIPPDLLEKEGENDRIKTIYI
jgi:DNA helicase-2/ATP-dependent DNA helicase PcrA